MLYGVPKGVDTTSFDRETFAEAHCATPEQRAILKAASKVVIQSTSLLANPDGTYTLEAILKAGEEEIRLFGEKIARDALAAAGLLSEDELAVA